ncbi:alpha/beta fold hydrolase [Rufibacter glacialis]|uniref:Alpha/beta fold hydrolase n=1 Tax=Rufibacter glacialis TaxID=1259555 RepID=A0A5M8QJG2_9BACT|nr:alpha/beta hydrolase [Rufibacter glacialis]KAA6434472.1 alpha/beta hydrolase [Rufibacter glacialis]GGK69949.1 alpha/beta hydrolase [Rufibacter glacialis]
MKRFRTSLLFLFLFSAFFSQAQLKPLDAELTNYTYPFPVAFHPVKVQKQAFKMAFMDVKPQKPNGQTVVLLHGKNFNGAYWEQTAQDLAKNGFRVIIPDQIGFGKSSKPQNIQYTFQMLAQNTKGLLDSLGVKKAAVLGHSMGGMLATRFALMYPEFTEKLILENPIGLEDWKRWVPYQSVEKWYAGELKQTQAGIKKYQLENYYGGQWKPAYDQWANLLAGWITGPDYPQVAWNAALTYDMIFTQPVVYEFDQLQMPVLLIMGQRDRTALGKANAPAAVREKLGNYPLLGKETAKKIKNAKLVELENVGHLPHIEAYERFIQPLLAFLRG